MELRTWQKEAIEYFKEHRGVALFQVPTGAGKTIFAIHIIRTLLEQNNHLRTLIIVPKNVILEKTWLKELYDNGFTIKDVGIYNGFCKEYNKITITTMSSVDKIDYSCFNFLIADEVHHVGTTRLLKVINHPWRYKLGLSATIERQDHKHWKIKEAFEYNVFEYDISSALEDGVINKFDFINITLELDPEDREHYDKLTMYIGMLMAEIGGYDSFNATPNSNMLKQKIMSAIDERRKLILGHRDKFDVVVNICKKNPESKIIVFSQFNSTTNSLYYYLSSENIKAGLIHSQLSGKQKTRVLTEYKENKFNVLLSTKMLDEGYNLPSIDIGIIVAGESTKLQTIQRLGRILRKKDKVSKLYQMYFKDTFEQKDAIKRTQLIKPLALTYLEEEA